MTKVMEDTLKADREGLCPRMGIMSEDCQMGFCPFSLTSDFLLLAVLNINYISFSPTIYSASRIHLREWCAMHHTAVRLNRFIKCYIGRRLNNEFRTRLMWWLTRFAFINNHSIYGNSSKTAQSLRSSNNALLIVPSTKTVTAVCASTYHNQKFNITLPIMPPAERTLTYSTSSSDRHDHPAPRYCCRYRRRIMAPLTNSIDIDTLSLFFIFLSLTLLKTFQCCNNCIAAVMLQHTVWIVRYDVQSNWSDFPYTGGQVY